MNNDLLTHKEEINLYQIYLILWDKKLLILIITLSFALISVVYSLLMPNIYTSKTTLVPVKIEESLSSRLGSLSSFTAISGVNINYGAASKSQEAIARIESFDFFKNHFYPFIEVKNITAIKDWYPESNTIIYDNSLLKKKFSDQQVYEIYKNFLIISQDKVTQFVTISIDNKSPLIAKQLLDIIILNINESMRVIDIQNAQKAIDYLNESSKATNIQSLKDAISNLLEDQLQILMLASSSDSYIFKTLDPPIVPEVRSSPNRAIICIFGTIFGFIFAIFLVFLVKFYKEIRS